VWAREGARPTAIAGGVATVSDGAFEWRGALAPRAIGVVYDPHGSKLPRGTADTYATIAPGTTLLDGPSGKELARFIGKRLILERLGPEEKGHRLVAYDSGQLRGVGWVARKRVEWDDETNDGREREGLGGIVANEVGGGHAVGPGTQHRLRDRALLHGAPGGPAIGIARRELTVRQTDKPARDGWREIAINVDQLRVWVRSDALTEVPAQAKVQPPASGPTGSLPGRRPTIPYARLALLRISGQQPLATDAELATMKATGMTGTKAMVRLCLDKQGDPASVTLVRPTGVDSLDERVISVVKTWRHKPYLVDGKATDVCAGLMFRFGAAP
jgi:TonB family protein